jgi:hypothetical protein
MWGKGGRVCGGENSVGSYRKFVIEVVVCGFFSVNVEPFYGVEVWAFLVEL